MRLGYFEILCFFDIRLGALRRFLFKRYDKFQESNKKYLTPAPGNDGPESRREPKLKLLEFKLRYKCIPFFIEISC